MSLSHTALPHTLTLSITPLQLTKRQVHGTHTLLIASGVIRISQVSQKPASRNPASTLVQDIGLIRLCKYGGELLKNHARQPTKVTFSKGFRFLLSAQTVKHATNLAFFARRSRRTLGHSQDYNHSESLEAKMCEMKSAIHMERGHCCKCARVVS